MISRKLVSFLAFSGLMLAGACSKDGDNGNTGGNNNPTEVVVTVPTNNQVVVNGTNLVVDGTVTDLDILANVSVQIRNKTSGAVLYSAQTTTATVSFYRYTFNWTVAGVSSAFTGTVKVTARDIYGGEGIKEVDINLEP
jgi:hypothetical protein